VSTPILGPTQSYLQWVLGVQQLGREADHSHLVSRIRMSEPIPPLTPYAYMASKMVKLTFCLYILYPLYMKTLKSRLLVP